MLHSGPYISGPLYPPLLRNTEISFRAWSSFLSHGLWLQPGDFFVQDEATVLCLGFIFKWFHPWYIQLNQAQLLSLIQENKGM